MPPKASKRLKKSGHTIAKVVKAGTSKGKAVASKQAGPPKAVSRVKPLGKPSPARKRGRSVATLHVRPAIQGVKRGWSVDGKFYLTQAAAKSRAKKLMASIGEGEVVVHGRDGSVVQRITVRPKKASPPVSVSKVPVQPVKLPISAKPADDWDFEAELAREYSKRSELMRRLAR